MRLVYGFLLLMVLPVKVGAFDASEGPDTGGGDSGGFCCVLPPELEERGQILEESFGATSSDDLARQRWAGTLCDHHPCAGEVTEDQAKDLLDSFAFRQSKWIDGFVSWGGLIVAGMGLAVSLFALRQSGRNERDIGKLQKNEDSLAREQQ